MDDRQFRHPSATSLSGGDDGGLPLHVDDLCSLVLEQMERFEAFEGQAWNVGGGRTHSVSLCELTELCQEATGNTVSIGSEPETRMADVRVYLSDCTKLFQQTAWRPTRTAHDTVADIAIWLRERAGELAGIVG